MTKPYYVNVYAGGPPTGPKYEPGGHFDTVIREHGAKRAGSKAVYRVKVTPKTQVAPRYLNPPKFVVYTHHNDGVLKNLLQVGGAFAAFGLLIALLIYYIKDLVQ